MYLRMKLARTHVVFSLAILLACRAAAFALDPSSEITQYAHTAWRERDGFAKGFIYSIAQTPDGYLWLGTEFGLLRFDGVRAVAWQPHGERLPGESIWSLLVARDGTLWIGTDKGLVSWNHAKLTLYSELTGQIITALLEDREGAVWVGTAAYPSGGKLCEIRNAAVSCHGGDGTFGGSVFGLYEDSKGTLWLGVGGGFWRWKPGPSEFFLVPGQRDVIHSFAEDEGSTLLVGTEAGIQRFVGGRLEPYRLPHFPEAFHPKQMLRDHEGSLWIATFNSGLVHVHNGTAESLSESDGLSGTVCQALLEDREGNIWAATLNGLDRFRDYAVPNISIKQGLSSANTFSVLAANDRTLWIASGKGLDRWKDGQISRPDGGGMAENKLQRPAHALFQDHSGRVYFSSSDEFGYLADDHFVAIRDFPQGWVHSAAELGAGQLWVANQANGLLHIADGKIVQAVPWAGMGHKDFAFAVVADPSKKGLWLGFSGGGVAYFEDGAMRASYSEHDGLGAGSVHGLRFGPRGALWASTQGGLSRIKDGQIRTLTSKNGLPCDKVHWSMEDDDNSMWLYMSCGLVRVARSDMDSWVADTSKQVHTTVLGVSDGVRSHSFPPPVQSVTKSADGKIWFAALDGVSIIDPHNLHENKLPPAVHIESITADDKTVQISNGMHLPTGVHHLDIDYTALSLVVPEKVRFRVKLEGEDKDWRELVNVRHVEYTNLPPKHYRFRVIACNNSGVWNEEGAALDFVIPPAWYQTNGGRRINCGCGSWRRSSTCVWKNGWQNAPGLLAICTTPCCRVFRHSCHCFRPASTC